MQIDRKQLIVEAATKSFTLFGYKATTMEQVAKLANVGKGTIYNFYKNKEQLFQEIVSTHIDEMKRVAEESLVESLPVEERVYAALNAILEYRTKHQFMMKLLEEEKEMGTPAVAEMVNEIEKEIITYIQMKLEKAMDGTHNGVCDSELFAFLLYKMYSALIFDWEKNHKSLDREEIAKVFQFFVMKGLLID
ncbi:MAG: TetR/AcrR family transcriptional regulator [Bacillus sp. (in: firmicutes)]